MAEPAVLGTWTRGRPMGQGGMWRRAGVVVLAAGLMLACSDSGTKGSQSDDIPAEGDVSGPDGRSPTDTEPVGDLGEDGSRASDTSQPPADVGPDTEPDPGSEVTPDTGPPPECTQPSDCADDNPCTDDHCDGVGKCVYTFNDEPCDDGNVCTDEVCAQGACAPTPNDEACDDADPCTEGDQCQDGVCAGHALLCADDNECTVDYCSKGACKHKLLEAPQCELRLEVTTPLRGATLWNKQQVQVGGKVTAPAGPLTSLTLNDVDVTPAPGGEFATVIVPEVGVNLIEVKAEDEMGQTTETVQAFLYGHGVLAPGTEEDPSQVSDGFGLWLSDEVFDDDDTSDLDDLSTLAWMILKGFDLEAAIPSPLTAEGEGPGVLWCTWSIDLSDLSYTVGEVDILPMPGGLSLSAELTDVAAWIEAVAPGLCPDGLGWVYADAILIDASFSIAVVAGEIQLTTDDVDVTLSGVEIDLEQGALSLFNWIIDWFEGDLAATVEEQFETFLPEQIVPMLEGVLGGFTSLSQTLELPSLSEGGEPLPLTLAVEIETTAFDWDDEAFGLAAGTSAAKMVTVDSPGSILRGSCGPGSTIKPPTVGGPNSCQGRCGDQAPGGCYCDALCLEYEDCCADFEAECVGKAGPGSALLPHLSAFEGYFMEDLANQVLFTLWRGGYTQMTIDGALFGDALASFGISDLVLYVAPLLPPVVTTCTEGGEAELQLGDAYLEAAFMMNGEPGSFAVYASARLGVEFGVVEVASGPNQLAIEKTELAEIKVDVLSAEGFGDVGEDLVKMLFTQVVGGSMADELLAGLAQAYSLPAFDLGGLVPGLPVGSEIAFSPELAELDAGYILIGGEIQQP